MSGIVTYDVEVYGEVRKSGLTKGEALAYAKKISKSGRDSNAFVTVTTPSSSKAVAEFRSGKRTH